MSSSLIQAECLSPTYCGLDGAANDARVYSGAGSGAVDYSSPYATVEMGRSTAPARYTWQSGPLTDGQESRFVVRVATAPGLPASKPRTPTSTQLRRMRTSPRAPH